MVHPLAFPLKSTFERVNGNLEALIETFWEKETREALQDVSRGDNDNGNGDDDDPGGDEPHSGGRSAKDRSKKIKIRFDIDDTGCFRRRRCEEYQANRQTGQEDPGT